MILRTSVISGEGVLRNHGHLLDDFPAVAELCRRLVCLAQWYNRRVSGL